MYTKFSSQIIFLLVLVGLALAVHVNITRLAPQQPNTPVPSTSRELSDKEYAQVRGELFSLIKNQDPKAAISRLTELMKSDPKVYRSCHPLAHEVGQESYRKYNDFLLAMSFRDSVCASGFLHGVMEAYLSTTKEVKQAILTACDAREVGFLMGSCWHAVGHGLMYYTVNDLPGSLSLCNTFYSAVARERCAEGVYMENFLTDRKTHPSSFLKADNLFYPCTEFPQYRPVCYFYAPINYLENHKEDYKGALAWCEEAGGFRASCASGLGSRLMKENIDDPRFVEDVCAGDPALTKPCIDGVVSYQLVNFNSLSAGRDLCSRLETANQAACFRAVSSRRYIFPG